VKAFLYVNYLISKTGDNVEEIHGHEGKEITQAFLRKYKELPSLFIDLTSLPKLYTRATMLY